MLDPAPMIISASWEGKVTGVDKDIALSKSIDEDIALSKSIDEDIALSKSIDEDIALSKSIDWNMHSSIHVPLDTIYSHPWTQRRILQLNSNLTFKEIK